MSQKKIFTLGILLILTGLILSACASAAPANNPAPAAPAKAEEAVKAPEPTEAIEPAETSEAPAEASQSGKVQIRWFCCLGTGDNPAQVDAENKVVADFNASHPNIELVMEIVKYEAARDALSTEIASGNPPDFVGPVGVNGAEAYHGQWLDLAELIKTHNYDLSQFDEGAVNFYKVGGEGQIGLPFAIYPSVVFYQREMFDEAGLNYPPHKYGEKYKWPDGAEAEWNYDTLRQVAMKLTIDKNGNDATHPDFDPKNIVQYGYEPTYQDLRAIGSYFGAGTMVAPDGKTVQIPPEWVDAWKWLYNGMWQDHFIPTETVIQADEFGQGNPFNSGRIAITLTHQWYTCCLMDAGNNWDVGVVPSHKGKVTANFNADTFRILKSTKHPAETFEVVSYLLGDASMELLSIYDGMPARTADQEPFFEAMAQDFSQNVDWPVFIDGIAYADNPSFEAYMPNYNEALDLHVTVLSKWRTTAGLDMDAEIAALQKDLQAIYDKKK